MKKLLCLLLACLLLYGCVDPGPTEPDPSATVSETVPETQEPTQPPEVLETYEIPYADCYAALPMGEDILLFTGVTETTLVKVRARDLKEQASAALDCRVDPTDAALRVSEAGVSYYDGSQVVFLDPALGEASRISLPAAICDPVVTADLQTIYYADTSAIRAIDRETGLDRLLRESTQTGLTLRALHCGDTVLECTFYDASPLFLSAQTGALIHEGSGSISPATEGDLWFATVYEGGYSQLVFGTGSEKPQVLVPAEDYAAAQLVGGLNGVILTVQTEDTTTLMLYDLTTGTLRGSLELPGAVYLWSVWGDGETEYIWFLTGTGSLYRWDLSGTAPMAGEPCTAPYYTREEPDQSGLAALETRVRELEARFGVEIRLGEEALAVQPWDYTFTSEYQVPRLSEGLDALEEALALYPDGFLKALGKASNSGTVHISLVQSMTGSADLGSLDTADGIQFWDDNGNACIALALDSGMAADLHHELFHIIDTRVLSEDSAYDNWDRLNPRDFDYDYDYITNQGRDGSAWLEPGSEAFIDTYAMSFPKEDRARIFEYAIQPGNESSFASDTMQKKLACLCDGIREAFGLEDAGELPWEQYLQ